MGKFKKTTIVEAVRWDGRKSTLSLLRDIGIDTLIYYTGKRQGFGSLAIFVSSVRTEVAVGNWIIKEDGMFYLCSPREFKRDFEPVEGE